VAATVSGQVLVLEVESGVSSRALGVEARADLCVELAEGLTTPAPVAVRHRAVLDSLWIGVDSQLLVEHGRECGRGQSRSSVGEGRVEDCGCARQKTRLGVGEALGTAPGSRA